MREIKVKANGLRNELKEIRKSIDKLTEVLLLQQTNKRNEIFNISSSNGELRNTKRHKPRKV